MFNNLDYCNLDYFSYTYKDNKIIWMKVGGPLTLVGNFI
jgi:hypothetical protein